MENGQKERFKRVLKRILPILILGAGYYIFIRLTGLAIPCIFKAVSGKYCAGCGITRMFLSIFRLDFLSAARNNLLVFVLLFPTAFYGSIKVFKYVKSGEVKYTVYEKVSVIIIFLLMILFWVIRNLPQFAYLAPIPY